VVDGPGHQILYNKNQLIYDAIIERVGACIQSFNANCNIQWFRCMLDRLWGAIGVFEMFIYRLGGANHFFISWGMHELFKQNVLWLSFDRDCIAAVWRCAIAATLVSNRQQLQMDLARYC